MLNPEERESCPNRFANEVNFVGSQDLVNSLSSFGSLLNLTNYKKFDTSNLQEFQVKMGLRLSLDLETITLLCAIYFCSLEMGRKKKTTKRKLAHPKLPMQRQLNLQHEGTHFDLRAIFDDLNERHFRKRLRGYQVVWGRRRKHRPREQFVFGTIQEEDRVIRINPALDQPFVPRWFLRYVLYHEMLHSVVPDETLSRNRRRVHTEEFNRRECEFRDYRRARRWEDENLSRFLR